MIRLAIMVAIGWLLVSQLDLFTSSEWRAFVYPNKNNLEKHVEGGTYKTVEECRSAAISMLTVVSSPAVGDYECGLNCKSDPNLGGLAVCKETMR